MNEIICIIGCCFIGGFLAPLGDDLAEMYRDEARANRIAERSYDIHQESARERATVADLDVSQDLEPILTFATR
jgi:hypothetical protein